MVEEQKQPQPTPETKPKDKIQEAKEIADRLESLKIETSENIRRLEELKSEEILGGVTQSGKPKEEPKVNPEDYAKRALEGRL